MNLFSEETEETEQALSFTEPKGSEVPFDSTKDNDIADSEQGFLLESVSPELYNLSYTCLLIPRFPSHFLKGDLADLLPMWMQNICISFNYRLEFLTVDPNYMQLAIIVPPTITPVQFMGNICEKTSEMIIGSFGRIRKENLSGKFWAEGYLVVLGTRPHSEEMITQFIRLTRKQQGLINLF